MGKRTKLKSKYRKRSKRTRKYSFKKRKTTRKRRKQKGGSDTNQQTLNNDLLKACDKENDSDNYKEKQQQQQLIEIQHLINKGADIDCISNDDQLLNKYNNDDELDSICPLIIAVKKKIHRPLELLLTSGANFEVVKNCWNHKSKLSQENKAITFLSRLYDDEEETHDIIHRRLMGDELHKLINKNKIDSITEFLKKYIDIYYKDGIKEFEYISSDLNINVKDLLKNYQTPLIKSIDQDLPDIGIELLILGKGHPINNELKDYLYKIKVNSQDLEGNTALHHAIEKIKDLIDKLNTGITDELYIKLESYFCLIQHIMKIYSEKRTDSMKIHFDQEVQSPLYITNKEGKPPNRRIIEYFPSEGANKKVITHLKIKNFLKFYEKDPNKRVLKGKKLNPWKNASSLMKQIYPSFQRSEESYSNKLLSLIPNYSETHVLNFLTIHHENINLGTKDKKSMNILDHVIDREFIKVLKYLVENSKIDLNDKSENPLIKAAIMDKREMVNYLLTLDNVNIYIQDATSKTPLIHAIIKKNYDIAFSLLNYYNSPNVTIEDKERKDALSYLLISACSEDTLEPDTYVKVKNIIRNINKKITNNEKKKRKYAPLIKKCSEKPGHRASGILLEITNILFPKNPSRALPVKAAGPNLGFIDF